MNDTVLAVLVAAVLAGLGGLLVPRLVARVPEPVPKPVGSPDGAGPDAGEPGSVATQVEPPKTRYADIAGRPGLGWRSAVVSAVSGALLGAATGLDWSLLWLVPLTPVAVALSVIDWHTRLLPRVVVVPATLAAIVAVTAVGLATGERESLVRALVAMVLARSFFWVLWFVRSAGMGFGDVRLAAPVGLVLGWAGWGELAIGVWASFVLFVVPVLVVLVVRRDRSLLKRAVPFGPFMCAGALVGLVWGTALAGRIWG
ncbi:A24 family peptidase [Nocardioides sp. zg-1228]|uniref:prepilin peptidase n=1 Tax=Nocardioides sp. zg-1228 TaxID=2763008 RepID=UPI001642DE04|nr:A24 family peptidase [Nocardioides sp. zg-1228]MBC2933635.1 prepilin peptidase [Nocardioides sp. zg-1228]QSF56244.1 prepilin peptidase [Nocardioides sp. zg-1228]